MGTQRNTFPGTAVDNVTDFTAAQINGMPGGLGSHDKIITDSAASGSLHLVATCVIDALADRIYHVKCKGCVRVSTPASVQWRILEDGQIVDRVNQYVPIADEDWGYTWEFEVTPAAAGEVTYTLFIASSAGTVQNMADDVTAAGTHGSTHLWVADTSKLSEFA